MPITGPINDSSASTKTYPFNKTELLVNPTSACLLVSREQSKAVESNCGNVNF